MRKQEGSSIFLFIFRLPSLKNSLECVSLAGMGVEGAGIRDQIENKPKEMFPKKPSHLTSNMSMTNQVRTVNVSSLRTSPVIVSACEGISQSVAM